MSQTNSGQKRGHDIDLIRLAGQETGKIEFQQILAGLNTLVLSEEQAGKVLAILREKNPSTLDAWHMELKEEKVKVAQFQEQQEAAERERNLSLANTQSTYREIDRIKIRIKQLSEETELTISHLQLEKKNLRDAFKTTWEKIRPKCSCR
ncbi:hypothetical protein SKAU_G00063310 [Synaphobranchus kaupii]|uniref:Uncharacterized protein n=1 Tax=Synaphobranchus kaupii TaxID=118154 RepID=A0A9Q1J9T8_SYNKA|nr:hypothetical protein SKAU_G00063310 [Synaphobranchus kaupii]